MRAARLRHWRRLGGLGDLLRLAHFFHQGIHHRRTFTRSLVVQFDDARHRARVDALLRASFGARARQDRYGLTVTGPLEYMAFTAVPLLINTAAAWRDRHRGRHGHKHGPAQPRRSH